ncbi:MAG: AraC family transcriptional regulator [Bacteroidota bacterium]
MHETKFLNSGDIKIAAYCYATIPQPVSYFYEEAALVYTSTGVVSLTSAGKNLRLLAGQCAIIRQYAEVEMQKELAAGKQDIETLFFSLPRTFLKKALPKLQLPSYRTSGELELLKIAPSAIVSDHFRSIKSYIAAAEDIEEEVVAYKITSLLEIIAAQNQRLTSILGPPLLANDQLTIFMEANFRRKVTISTLAQEFGTSLSSFNREFKRIFGSTPQRWITKRRLNEARVLLESTAQRPSQVYLQVGFQDLAHFSRAFKKQFGRSPSQLDHHH